MKMTSPLRGVKTVSAIYKAKAPYSVCQSPSRVTSSPRISGAKQTRNQFETRMQQISRLSVRNLISTWEGLSTSKSNGVLTPASDKRTELGCSARTNHSESYIDGEKH